MTAPMNTNEKTRILNETFGFTSFREGQEEVVDALVRGEDVLAVMPTGAGKSLCYQVPALVRDGLAIVVSPLVALMRDQVAALALNGVAVETINSSRDRAENVDAWLRAADGRIKLLYLSPERLMTDRMLAALAKLDISLIAVDEAHCISQWGPSFRPEYEDLARLRQVFPSVPIAAFTATADEVTRADIRDRMFGERCHVFVQGFDRPNIRLAVEPKRSWKKQLLEVLAEHKGDNGIVYCLSRAKTEDAAGYLRDNGFRAMAYHAGMDAEDREIAQSAFMTEPDLVIVATIAFGMGIDKPDVRFVAHADLPGSIESYYQEIGRAGRDGLPATAHMLYGLDDIRMRRVFIEQENGDDERKRRENRRLDAFLAYCEAPECRRQSLLAYFGEASGPCGNCDVCQSPIATTDGTEEAQKLLSAVYRTGQIYGSGHVVDVVTGAATEKIRSAGHDQLPSYGSGKERSKDEWRSLLRQLVATGCLKIDIAGYGGLSMTEKGELLLKGEETFRYRPDAMPKKGSGKTRAKSAKTTDLSEDDRPLYEALRELRRDLARERGVPAYVIFTDRALQDMSARRPQTVEEFSQCHGVGEAKRREFAETFLTAIAAKIG
ncbi:MAG: DNA helicase RecQ [Rhodospirillaceae bacterium]|nr:DNA helicase RecQ [Rhodospirillaceae bacterium]